MNEPTMKVQTFSKVVQIANGIQIVENVVLITTLRQRQRLFNWKHFNVLFVNYLMIWLQQSVLVVSVSSKRNLVAIHEAFHGEIFLELPGWVPEITLEEVPEPKIANGSIFKVIFEWILGRIHETFPEVIVGGVPEVQEYLIKIGMTSQLGQSHFHSY